MSRIETRLDELGLKLPALNVELWGEAGRHARLSPGQGPAPPNVPVIVDAIAVVA
jgi:hypothetical protein